MCYPNSGVEVTELETSHPQGNNISQTDSLSYQNCISLQSYQSDDSGHVFLVKTGITQLCGCKMLSPINNRAGCKNKEINKISDSHAILSNKEDFYPLCEALNKMY